MPYWFRAVEKFAPWVRKIHFVTCGHVPAFLNLAHPKLHHVKHADFLPPEVLPTFSSCHRDEPTPHSGAGGAFCILQRRYVFDSLGSGDCVFRDGLPCTYGGEYPIELVGEIGIWQHAAVNDLGVINVHFNKRTQVKKYGGKYANRAYRWQDNLRTRAVEKLFPNYFTGFKTCMPQRRIQRAPLPPSGTRNQNCWRGQPRTASAVQRI